MKLVLNEFNLSLNTEIFARENDDSHLMAIGKKIAESMIAEESLHLLCTGRSTSVAFLRTLLRKAGVEADRILSVPYWRDGRGSK